MTASYCCAILTLFSLMASDLHQTATFTAETNRPEINFLVAPIVEPSGVEGEIALGIAGAAFALGVDRLGLPYTDLFFLAWGGGHLVMIINNQKKGNEIPLIVFPFIELRF